MVRFVVCLDGTWNNAAREQERKDGTKVYRPSNVLKVARATTIATSNVTQVTYYDAGVGGMNRSPTGASRALQLADNVLGGALGAGFEVNIEEAYSFLSHNYQAGDELFVFGFSRGAAQARSLCRFIEWVGGFPAKRDAFYVPTLFTRYLAEQGKGSGADYWSGLRERAAKRGRGTVAPIVPAPIKYLGVWDTVLALGSRFRPRTPTVQGAFAFHTPATPPASVERIRHGLAVDERRHDFQAEIFNSNGHPDLEQRWFPGVHSNVGGGLVDDSLANCSLRWMVDEAMAVGLEIDEDFMKFFRKYPGGYMSEKSRAFRIADTVLRPLRGYQGERDLLQVPDMTLDDSVLVRLNANPDQHATMDGRYRPRNVLRYLAQHPQLHTGLDHGVKAALGDYA